MIRPSDAGTPDRELGALVDDIRVRVINCSATGCLLESGKWIAEGTIATLQLSIGGRTFSEVAEVVRCQPVDRRNDLYHVGAQFLSTTAPHAGSLRYAMRREGSELARWLTGGIATSGGQMSREGQTTRPAMPAARSEAGSKTKNQEPFDRFAL